LKVVSDYELLCKIMSDTYVKCRTEYRRGAEVKNHFTFQTSIISFTFELDDVEIVKEDPPYRLQMKTIEGGPAREVEIFLVPIDNNAHTLIFSRCYTQFGSAGLSVRLALKAVPMAEPLLSIAAGNYANRAYKNEAERRVGFKALPEPRPLDVSDLDIATLRLIDQGNGGLIQETPEGKIIGALAYTFIDAPPKRVWEVITDFDHYEDIFSAPCKVESRKDNQVTVNQKTATSSVIGMKFGYELHARYTLEPPDHLSYVAIDGVNKGSHGDFRIMPLNGGSKSILFSACGINMENDNSIVARIAKSGAFPMEIMIDMTLAQSTLARIRIEAQRRKSGNSHGSKK